MISFQELLMGRDAQYPLTELLEHNLAKLHASLNKFRAQYGKPMYVTSGYRPGHYNKAAGGAAKSAHLTCEACDFADPKGKLAEYCLKNLKLLELCGLWMEDPSRTIGWVHLQTRPVSVRVFKP